MEGLEGSISVSIQSSDYFSFCSSTLFVGKHGLEQAKQAIVAYKTGQTNEMTPELWHAKKIVDSTLHPGMHTTARS